jgi:curli production assembly/transport component CsgG
MKLLKPICLSFLFLLSSCGAYFNQPVDVQKATLGEATPATKLLKNLPKVREKVVVGVYKFRDQTGQYKAVESGSTFSTAVTQGATSILVKALEDSKWFIPIERENLGNLLNERNIIRSTRQEYLKNTNPNEPQLTPLLYAGVLIEGGIVSFDSNIITGGFGARYFGAGSSTRYRQDRVSIYLRLVSTSNGEILKTVYISKTILSQAVDASLFRYVNFKRLLEVETGFTKNEPMHLAVTEAIEKGVESLVIEGIQDGIWKTDSSKEDLDKIMKSYSTEEKDADAALLYGRTTDNIRRNVGLEISGGATQIDSDFENPVTRPLGKVGLKFSLNPYFNIATSLHVYGLSNKDKFDDSYASFDVNSEFFLLPKDKLTPYFYAGIGAAASNDLKQPHFKTQFGGGLEYLFSKKLGIRVFGEQNITITDKIDYKVAGKLNDNYWRAGLGLIYYFGKKQK